jgi:hypothetical protein
VQDLATSSDISPIADSPAATPPANATATGNNIAAVQAPPTAASSSSSFATAAVDQVFAEMDQIAMWDE